MNEVAVVTGASRGIGAAVAPLLAARGWTVVVNYREREDEAARVVERCLAGGGAAHAVRADVATEEGVAALFATTDDLGRLRALVNNAGVADVKARVEDMTGDRLRRMLGVNVVGPFLCAAAAVRRMSTRHGGAGGAIVNVSSTAARLGGPGEYVDYAASKGAIDTFTTGLAREVAAEGIRVNGVRPGLIATDIHASSGRPERIVEMARQIPVGRAGRPEEVAAAIAWLCSEEAAYVVGSILDVGGGR